MLNIGIPARRSPLTRAYQEQPAQLEIPMPPQPPARRESVRLHNAIVELRHRGFVVRRNGHMHRVDGIRMTTRQLMGILR